MVLNTAYYLTGKLSKADPLLNPGILRLFRERCIIMAAIPHSPKSQSFLPDASQHDYPGIQLRAQPSGSKRAS